MVANDALVEIGMQIAAFAESYHLGHWHSRTQAMAESKQSTARR